MAEKTKKSQWNISLSQRWKIPWLDLFIVEGSALRRDEEKFKALEAKFEILEGEFKRELFTSKLRLKMNTKLRDRLNVVLGNVRAPECPKCGRPKKPGGIQWIDHAKCERKKPEGPALEAQVASGTYRNGQ